MNINIQDKADEYTKRFLKKAEEKIEDTSKIPSGEITRYCRMLTIYCDAEGKVTDGFIRSMEKCAKEIIEVDGMEEVFTECNECFED